MRSIFDLRFRPYTGFTTHSDICVTFAFPGGSQALTGLVPPGGIRGGSDFLWDHRASAVIGVRHGASPPACGPRGRYGVHCAGRLGRSWGPPAHRPQNPAPHSCWGAPKAGGRSGCFGEGATIPSPGCPELTRGRYDLHSPTCPETFKQHEL